VIDHRQQQASSRGGAMKRRTLLAMSAVAAGCGRRSSGYFGRTTPPRTQRLTMAIGAGPGTLDPAESWDIWEPYVIRSLFEGLTDYHPQTLEPIAALATHFEVNPDQTQFTFYLRGHRNPLGINLPGAPPDGLTAPARWSDGQIITAKDFVYSWRRVVDPANAFPTASLFSSIRNGQAVNAGKMRPEHLGVRAVNDFALQVDLHEPAPYFAQLAASNQFFPAPRRAIEAAGSAWTTPPYTISSGAFRLRKWRDGEVVLEKSPTYYNARKVSLEELRLVTILRSTTAINLYKAGNLDLVTPLLPALYLRLLRQAPDFHTYPAAGMHYFVMNTTKPPLDNLLVRYALNMAIDKKEIERFRGAGSAALSLLPSIDSYPSPRALTVSAAGRNCDILAFDPPGAQSLMRAAGFSESRPLKVEYLYPAIADHRLIFEILQRQLRQHLGVEMVPIPKEAAIVNQETFSLEYRGIAAWADTAVYQDPTYFLDQFLPGASANVTGWNDPGYASAMSEARSFLDTAARFQKLAECERMLLRAMPVIPLYFDAWQQLRKPYVRGIEGNSIAAIAFHRVWIDTNWRPS
jgi:ABC-type oligopeptide transport system substrate-binding subunit